MEPSNIVTGSPWTRSTTRKTCTESRAPFRWDFTLSPKPHVSVCSLAPVSRTNTRPGLEIAFSPTNCSFVQINENWTARWNKMQYSIDPMVKDEEGSRLPHSTLPSFPYPADRSQTSTTPCWPPSASHCRRASTTRQTLTTCWQSPGPLPKIKVRGLPNS